MPLNGNTYVAPVWRNGQPPALDPAELQAISDSIVRNQTDNANQDSLIAALQTAVGGKAQIEVGTYVGTGTYGASNPNSITFSSTPKLVLLSAYPNANNNPNPVMFTEAGSYTLYGYGGNGQATLTVSQWGSTIKWYSIDANWQLNQKNFTVRYIGVL